MRCVKVGDFVLLKVLLPAPEDFHSHQRTRYKQYSMHTDSLEATGDEQGGYYYIGNGGLLERWSFKLGIRDDDNGRPMMPLRNVYVVADGSILHRGAVAFRDCLRDEKNSDLKEEYGTLKWELAQRRDFVTIWDYTDEKKAVIRKVMKRAGWTDEEIIKKEELRVVNWPKEFII